MSAPGWRPPPSSTTTSSSPRTRGRTRAWATWRACSAPDTSSCCSRYGLSAVSAVSHPVLQCLAKKESCKFTQAEAGNGRDTEVEPLHQPGERERILRRLQSEKFIQSHNLARLSHSGEPRHVTSRHEILPCQLIISMIELAKEILFI